MFRVTGGRSEREVMEMRGVGVPDHLGKLRDAEKAQQFPGDFPGPMGLSLQAGTCSRAVRSWDLLLHRKAQLSAPLGPSGPRFLATAITSSRISLLAPMCRELAGDTASNLCQGLNCLGPRRNWGWAAPSLGHMWSQWQLYLWACFFWV